MTKIPQINNASPNSEKKSSPKFLRLTGYIIGSIILICSLILIFFSDYLLNTYLKDRITTSFTDAYPAYSLNIDEMHYDLWSNRLSGEEIKLNRTDSTYTSEIGSFSVSGINWIEVLLQGEFAAHTLESSDLNAKNVVFNDRRTQEDITFKTLHISLANSEMTVDSVKYYSLIEDEEFFARSVFRQTRFTFDVPQIKISGLDFLSILNKNRYTAKKIYINDMFSDILVNMDKPYNSKLPSPKMPNEFLSSIKEIVKIDSLIIANGKLIYRERYAVNASPGVITFDKINASVSRISNHSASQDTAIIIGDGIFMNSAKMKLFMAIPLESKEFSLQYSGSLSTMDVTALNVFIEQSEYQRIKSGVIESADFNVNVNSGNASGSLRVEYRDLSVAMIDETSGSEDGVFDKMATFLGKVFVIRENNLADENGVLRMGEIMYNRKSHDTFSQFVWFALRGSAADVIGLNRDKF